MKKWTVVALMINIIGWFPFMWVCLYGFKNKEYALGIFMFGMLINFIGAVAVASVMRNGRLFNSLDRLYKEIDDFKKAKDKYTDTKNNLHKERLKMLHLMYSVSERENNIVAHEEISILIKDAIKTITENNKKDNTTDNE